MPIEQRSLNAFSTDHLDKDLKGRSVRGGLLTLSSQAVQFIIQTVATVILARLLTPSDFGLVAMVTSVTGLANSFMDFGLSEATIQRKNITHEQVSALFWINLVIGVGLTLATAVVGPVIAWVDSEPRLRAIALLASFNFLVGGLRVQPNALLKRQMRYLSIAMRDVASYTVAVPVAVVMACYGAGYWALVALPLILNSVQMALSWLLVRWRPSFPRRGSSVRSMVIFGGNVSGSYLLTNLNRSVDAVLVGWYWGAEPLGLYSRAYNLLMLPVRQLSSPASSVAVPTFSRLQSEPERFARYYLRAACVIMWICAPLFGFLFVAATPVIALVLGPQWGQAAPVFRLLAVSAMTQIFLEMSIWLLISRGMSGSLLKLLLLISPVMTVSFLCGLPFGIKGVALAGSLAQIAIFPWMLHFTFRGTKLTLCRLGRSIVFPVSLSLLGVLFSEVALNLMAPAHMLSRLLVSALGLVVAYSLSVIIPEIRQEVLSFRVLFGAALSASKETA